MKRLFGLVSGLVLILYPFCVFYGIQQFGPRPICVFLLALFCLRFALQKGSSGPLKLEYLPHASLLGVLFCVLAFVGNRAEWLKFYPVLMNLFFLGLFALSLWHRPPMIERVARLHHPALSPRGVRHSAQVTVAWCVFFVVNGGIALYTALFASMETWTFYNGFLSYLAMALMFAVEYPIRRARMAQDKREAHDPSA